MGLFSISVDGEKEPNVFDGIEINSQISYIDLKKRIQEITNVPCDFQDLKVRGIKLAVAEHPLENFAFGEVIHVEHKSLPQWKNYLTLVEEFRTARNNKSRQEKVLEANEQVKQLNSVKFFSCYASFYTVWMDMRKEYSCFIDNIPETIKEAAKLFLIKKFSPKTIDVSFRDKPSGTRSGAMIIVNYDDVSRTYYVKTNHNASSISITQRGQLNMIELFIYKFLDVIELGARIDYIPNFVSSSKVVYICSEEIPGFCTMKEIANDWRKFERKTFKMKEEFSKSLIELTLLVQILGLGDINHENVGFIGYTPCLKIVDFKTEYIDDTVAFENINYPKNGLNLVGKLKWNLMQFNGFVKEMPYDKQLTIAKEFIVREELHAKLDTAYDSLENNKDTFRRTDLSFKQGTEDLKEYITLVRAKITQIIDL